MDSGWVGFIWRRLLWQDWGDNFFFFKFVLGIVEGKGGIGGEYRCYV